MIRRLAAAVLTASLAASTTAADLSQLPGADAAPPEQRQRLLAADAAAKSGDLAQAYELLRAARADGRLAAELARAIDVERDSLAQRLAEQLIQDAKARQKEEHPALAEKLLMQALSYRSTARAELRRFYADPAIVTAVGGTDVVRAKLGVLETDEASAAGLRWHLATLEADAPPAALAEQSKRLAQLRPLAGDTDAEIVAWARLLVRATASRLARRDGLAEGDLVIASDALGLGSTILGSADADVAAGAGDLVTARRYLEVHQLGPREGSWSVRVGAWAPVLRATFSASATPDAASPGFAAASASTSVSGTGLGWRLDARWLREPSPTGARSGYVWGGQLGIASASVESDLVLADADTAASSLNGRSFRSRIAVATVGAQLVGGWRWAIDAENSWSLQAHALAGAAAARESYGTRRGEVQGASADRTITKSGIAPEIGAEAELAWRPRPRWGLSAALGFDALWLPSISSDDRGGLVSTSSSTPGTYHESFGSVTAMGPYLLVGANYVF